MMLVLTTLMFIGAMYFLIIAPQNKRRKEHEKLVEGLKKGDSVMTAGGFYGKILSVKADRVFIQLAENVKVEIAKASIQNVLNKDKEKERLKNKEGEKPAADEEPADEK